MPPVIDLPKTADAINAANKQQTSQGLIIQTYCQSVKTQPKVNFGNFQNLKKYEQEINAGLGKAQAHADTYLNVIQPNIITNIANISNYYALHDAVPTSLPPGASEKEWIEALGALQKMAAEYKGIAVATADSIRGFYNNLTTDTAFFTKTVTDLNAAVNGNQGVLADIQKQLDEIESKIGGTIAGIVISGLTVVGGIIMTGIGAFASFVTGGAAAALVVGGIVITAGGVGGVVAASLALKGLYDAKNNLLTSQASLTQEVKLANGINSAFIGLGNQASSALTAAQQMVNAWDLLGADLQTMSDNLKNGIASANFIRTLFLNAANTQLQTQVIQDINTIKQQMTGVTQVPFENRPINEVIDHLNKLVGAS